MKIRIVLSNALFSISKELIKIVELVKELKARLHKELMEALKGILWTRILKWAFHKINLVCNLGNLIKACKKQIGIKFIKLEVKRLISIYLNLLLNKTLHAHNSMFSIPRIWLLMEIVEFNLASTTILLLCGPHLKILWQHQRQTWKIHHVFRLNRFLRLQREKCENSTI